MKLTRLRRDFYLLSNFKFASLESLLSFSQVGFSDYEISHNIFYPYGRLLTSTARLLRGLSSVHHAQGIPFA